MIWSLKQHSSPIKRVVERRTQWGEILTDLSFASTETKFKNPITKTQNNVLVNTVFLVKLFKKKAKMIISFFYEKNQK